MNKAKNGSDSLRHARCYRNSGDLGFESETKNNVQYDVSDSGQNVINKRITRVAGRSDYGGGEVIEHNERNTE